MIKDIHNIESQQTPIRGSILCIRVNYLQQIRTVVDILHNANIHTQFLCNSHTQKCHVSAYYVPTCGER